ncbi:bombyxin B-3-like isoform X2 [Bombyx mori]
MLILMRSSTIVFGDNAERVYSLDDKVKCCSRWLSIIIFNFCNNAYKIVKREIFNMKFTVMIVLMALAYVSAHKEAVTLCGRNLANARVAVCYGAEYVDKRTSGNTLFDDFEDVDLHGDWPWTGRRGALSADWTRYKRQGIVNECCFKPCTTDVLLKYC